MPLVSASSAAKNAQLSPGVVRHAWEGTDLVIGESGVAIAQLQSWMFSGLQLRFLLPDMAGDLVDDEVSLVALTADRPIADGSQPIPTLIDTIDVSSGNPTWYEYSFTLGQVVRNVWESAAAATATTVTALGNIPQPCLAYQVIFVLSGTYAAGTVEYDIDAAIVAKS